MIKKRIAAITALLVTAFASMNCYADSVAQGTTTTFHASAVQSRSSVDYDTTTTSGSNSNPAAGQNNIWANLNVLQDNSYLDENNIPYTISFPKNTTDDGHIMVVKEATMTPTQILDLIPGTSNFSTAYTMSNEDSRVNEYFNAFKNNDMLYTINGVDYTGLPLWQAFWLATSTVQDKIETLLKLALVGGTVTDSTGKSTTYEGCGFTSSDIDDMLDAFRTNAPELSEPLQLGANSYRGNNGWNGFDQTALDNWFDAFKNATGYTGINPYTINSDNNLTLNPTLWIPNYSEVSTPTIEEQVIAQSPQNDELSDFMGRKIAGGLHDSTYAYSRYEIVRQYVEGFNSAGVTDVDVSYITDYKIEELQIDYEKEIDYDTGYWKWEIYDENGTLVNEYQYQSEQFMFLATKAGTYTIEARPYYNKTTADYIKVVKCEFTVLSDTGTIVDSSQYFTEADEVIEIELNKHVARLCIYNSPLTADNTWTITVDENDVGREYNLQTGEFLDAFETERLE